MCINQEIWCFAAVFISDTRDNGNFVSILISFIISKSHEKFRVLDNKKATTVKSS